MEVTTEEIRLALVKGQSNPGLFTRLLGHVREGKTVTVIHGNSRVMFRREDQLVTFLKVAHGWSELELAASK